MTHHPTTPQREIVSAGPLLNLDGGLAQVGWARQPLLDCNLERAAFYRWRAPQRLRIKRWDYYGLITADRFYSFTLADLGYAGQVFAYVVGLDGSEYREDTLTIPFARGIQLPRNSTEATSAYRSGGIHLQFAAQPAARRLEVEWPTFAGGRGLSAEVSLALPASHESLVIVIPIGARRFYYNRKVNCMPASGAVTYAGQRSELEPRTALGNLDWGRGVWEYRSHWIWASASGFLPDGRTVGLNLGGGFGDTSAATENALILSGRVHKLGVVDFQFTSADYMRPWHMTSPDGRLDLEFVPFKERVAQTNLALIASQVHQMFGRYRGTVLPDDGPAIRLDGLIGFAEEHYARW
jgi:hypothetical protein